MALESCGVKVDIEDHECHSPPTKQISFVKDAPKIEDKQNSDDPQDDLSQVKIKHKEENENEGNLKSVNHSQWKKILQFTAFQNAIFLPVVKYNKAMN